jgi:hypothetical protein
MNRLSSLGFESWDLGGACDCFFNCFDSTVGMTVPELRRRVAQHMRDNEPIYGGLGDFETYGGYQANCDLVGTCGICVEGNAEIVANSDFISRHILILGADINHDVYIFAGAIGLGAPAHLGVDDSPIILAHCHQTQHYTRTYILHHPWNASKGAKPALKIFVDRMRVRQNSLSVRVQLLSLVLDL